MKQVAPWPFDDPAGLGFAAYPAEPLLAALHAGQAQARMKYASRKPSAGLGFAAYPAEPLLTVLHAAQARARMKPAPPSPFDDPAGFVRPYPVEPLLTAPHAGQARARLKYAVPSPFDDYSEFAKPHRAGRLPTAEPDGKQRVVAVLPSFDDYFPALPTMGQAGFVQRMHAQKSSWN